MWNVAISIKAIYVSIESSMEIVYIVARYNFLRKIAFKLMKTWSFLSNYSLFAREEKDELYA
jgi:hypothetical protein